MTIEGLERVGGFNTCRQIGMLQCQFDRFNKIVTIEMMFDVMGYMQQIQRASEISPESSIVPNTLDMALQTSKEAQAIVNAKAPYQVLHVNDAWTCCNGYSQSEAEGCSLVKVLQSYDYQSEIINKAAADCAMGRPGSTLYMSMPSSVSGANVKYKSSVPQLFYIKICPLTADTDVVSHILATIVRIPLSNEEINLFLNSKKICPLTADTDVVSHILATIVRIPLSNEEINLFLNSKMAQYVSNVPSLSTSVRVASHISSSSSSSNSSNTVDMQGNYNNLMSSNTVFPPYTPATAQKQLSQHISPHMMHPGGLAFSSLQHSEYGMSTQQQQQLLFQQQQPAPHLPPGFGSLVQTQTRSQQVSQQQQQQQQYHPQLSQHNNSSRSQDISLTGYPAHLS
eukprot:CAMPEP_0201114186 /NCGR_PEP_ID=MMETSP0812-20130820/78260_1 /ASSEMBLY_ACC=CAM_ASM_000668 /TAXON_ID=98059 /ORGANISM="Dinobryon sp., Strain UTEXLB2267" /LENGTH=396 /DNA_ID=CAMNT_0047377799 /DNA_START=38 /DNA_END=1228 /DNA_ORIENTATION=+